MNERKIIDRTLLTDLAKEVGLNASHLEALGESRQWEIVVGGDMLEQLVEIQHRFEQLAVMGEVGLGGEVRAIPQIERRVAECARLGFTTIVLPKENLRHLKAPEGVTLRGVDTVYQALSVLF